MTISTTDLIGLISRFETAYIDGKFPSGDVPTDIINTFATTVQIEKLVFQYATARTISLSGASAEEAASLIAEMAPLVNWITDCGASAFN